MHVIYTLRASEEDHEVRYVGKTASGLNIKRWLTSRLNGHRAAVVAGKTSPVCAWLRSLGHDPVIEPIGVCPWSPQSDSDKDARMIEELWIRALLRDGHRLTNCQMTGDRKRPLLTP